MSAALQSLMREAPLPRSRAPSLAGLPAFVAIGALGAGAFVVLSTTIIGFNTGLADWVVRTACYAALILPVYLLHRRHSFGSDVSHLQALPRYLAVQAMALVLAALFSYVIGGMLSVPTLFASILVIFLTSGVNFMVLRGWAFARSPDGVPVLA